MKTCLSFLFAILFCKAISAQIAAPIGYNSVTGNFTQYMSRTHIKTADNDASGKPVPIEEFNNVPNTKGERFLFNTWVKGDSVIDAKGNVVPASAMLFNYDKMTGNLLVTQNKVDVMSVAPVGVHSFVLEGNDHPYIFKHVKAIDSLKFFLQLAGNDSDYGFFKQFKCSFKAADYFSSGIIESGHRYDEYNDQSLYFIVLPGGKEAKEISLKNKSIKNAFPAGDDEKIERYFQDHKSELRDENFVAGLVQFLNES